MKYVTFSFDDGFLASTLKTARIFESFGLKAEFNVTALFTQEGASDRSRRLIGDSPLVDLDLLNELQDRGHVIQPHGYNHTDKATVGFSEAKDLVDRCIDLFRLRLRGFDPSRTVFCFPGNGSNGPIEQYVGSRFRAFRTGYNRVLNPLPTKGVKLIYGDSWPGVEANITQAVEELLTLEDGWLVYNTHGLDGEGWEPVTSGFLSKTIERLLNHRDLSVLPIVRVLDKAENA